MGYLSKGSTHPDFKNGNTVARTDQDKLKQFAEQLKSVFGTKIEIKDEDLEQESIKFLKLIFKIISPEN